MPFALSPSLSLSLSLFPAHVARVCAAAHSDRLPAALQAKTTPNFALTLLQLCMSPEAPEFSRVAGAYTHTPWGTHAASAQAPAAWPLLLASHCFPLRRCWKKEGAAAEDGSATRRHWSSLPLLHCGGVVSGMPPLRLRLALANADALPRCSLR